MTTTTAERSTQALTKIHDLITAIAGVQALIQAGVASPFCPTVTNDKLGEAYCSLAERLSMATALLP